MQVRSMLSSVAAASSRTPARATLTAPTLANSSSTTRVRPTGKPRPYHSLGHCGIAPSGIGELVAPLHQRQSGSQMSFEPGPYFRAYLGLR